VRKRKSEAVSEVRIARELKVPPVPAFASLSEIVAAIAAEERAWRDFTLHVSLGDMHLPDVGYIAIPIRLAAGKPQVETHSIEITFSAFSGAASFPQFHGQTGIDATGPTGSALWLAGSYDVPLQLFGKLIDRTVAAGLARRTLENLAADLAAGVTANVERREAEYARYRLY
jgi:hypothetical protein